MSVFRPNPLMALLIATSALAANGERVRANEDVNADKVAVVKSAFVVNFLRFTRWPEHRFDDDDSPIRIGVIGDDPLGLRLDAAVRGKNLNGRRITVHRMQFPDDGDDQPEHLDALERDLRSMHLVYICSGLRMQSPQIVRMVAGGSVLTIGDKRAIAAAGAMLALDILDGRVAIYANMRSITKSDLKISSKLLRLAKEVQPDK